MININTSFKKIHSLLILTFLCFLILINKTYSEEKIGSVVALKGEIIAINIDDEKRTLDIYDDIFLFDEIVTNNSSSITIQYDDNSTLIIKPSSSITVTEFVFSIEKKKFLGTVKKGKVIIESGKIAKNPKGSMEIQLPTMILGIKGTRFNMSINPDGTSEVSLSEDSFGEVGIINISSGGKVQTLYDTEQVISANIETGISERAKTDDEKKELVDASNDLIEASSIDDNLIQEKLEEKLANGNLLDANNDGIIDLSDIDIIKENIKIAKQENINFIVENSTGENTEFLSNVLNLSDEASIGESMNQILETNDYLVASVITNLADEDNAFLTTSNVEANNAIKEKIFTQMLNDTDDENNNIAVIGSIFSKSDADSVGLMMDTIQTVGETNADSTLALEVFSSMADSESFYDMDFRDEEYFGDETQKQFDQMMEIQEQYDQMMEQAVFSAAYSEEGAMMLANMMTSGNEESIYMMMDTIGMMAETNADSTLALEVFSSMADSESFYDMDFGDEGQEQYDQMMEQAVSSAADSEEGAMMLANMMTSGNEESIYMMMDTIGMMAETNADSTLALEVFSSMADSESFYDMDFGDEGQDLFDDMMEDAVYAAAYSDDGAMMLANMMTSGNEESIYMMMDTIGTMAETNPDSTLALEVFSSMADSESFYDMDFGDEGQEQYDQMMEQAVSSAAYSDDGAMMLANMMTNSDADTVGAMLDYITDFSENDPNSSFAAEVLSSVAGTATNTAYFDTEKMDQFYDFIDTATYTTYADDYDSFDDDMYYDASGFSMMPPYNHRDTGTLFDNDGFDRYGNEDIGEGGAADMYYDASGFSMMPPYNHRDTGTLFDNDGFDRYGNSDVAGGSYDANGFDDTGYHSGTNTLYDYAGFDKDGYHRETNTLYDLTGFDRNGNTEDATGDPTVTWMTLASSSAAASYTTSDTINLSASAMTTGDGVTYSISGKADLTFAAGVLSGSPTVANSPYSIEIYAEDDSCYLSCTGVSKITDTISFTVTDAGGSDPTVTWMTQASSSAAASYTTSDTINLSASAMTTGDGVTYSISGKADLTFAAGVLSGSPTVANSPYSIEIYAEDDSCYLSCTGVSKITDTISFTVTDAGGSDPTVTWMTQASSSAAASYTTSDTINLSASAMTTGDGVTYSISGKADLTFAAGVLSGSPTVANSPYSIEIYAEDDSCYLSCTGVSKITDTISFTVTDAGGSDPTVTWMTQASSLAAASYTTSDTINLSASAMTTGDGVTYSISGKADLTFAAGVLSGSPTVANSPYSIEIYAEDDSCYLSCTGVSKITDTISFTVTDAGGSDPTVTWMTQASSLAAASYTTSDTINLSASAMTTGDGVTYSISGKADLTFAAGVLSGSPTVANSPYSIEIYAEDDSCYLSCTGVSKITDTISFTVTDAGSYDARGFSTVTPFHHRVTDDLRDSQGYNSAGFDATGWSDADPSVYNEFYKEDVSPA